MLLSDSHSFLFVHIPKNAGSSINQALCPWALAPEQRLANRLLAALGVKVNHYGPWRGRRFRRHSTAQLLRDHLPTDVWQRLFKFAFVRNPWDRLVSQYKYILQVPAHHRHRLVQKMTFAEFADYWTGGGYASQTAFVTDSTGTVIVDFIGRCENIDDDFAHICRQLGVEPNIGHANRSRRKDYRSYYDAHSRDMVAARLRDELDMFEYTFDPPASLTRCA